MFSIQYEAANGSHQMQELNTRDRGRLIKHLASFSRPIVAVYENATPITKAMRAELAKASASNLTICAREFVRDRA